MNASRPLAVKSGFTLIELLVSMAILSIMLLAMATMSSFVSKVWLNGIGATDNFTKARVVLNLLDRDIQMMVMRRDLAAFVDSGSNNKVDGNGNAYCSFYTNVQGNPPAGASSPDTRALSLVQYIVSTPSATPTLQRLNYGVNFPAVAPAVTPTILMSIANTSSLPAPNNASVATETVFTGIVRFQIQFVDGNGAVTAAYNYPYSQPLPVPPTASRAVIVSMLVLSNSAYKLAIQNGGSVMTTLLADFPNTSLPTGITTWSQYWNSILTPTTGTLDVNLPPVVRGGIQVFERRIPLPMTTPSS
jgi:prepilin-type N-terminal cleavage/methylation domain-containing protein